MTTIDQRFGEITDVLGVGIGPFNLSLAALLGKVNTIKNYFFDQSSHFDWHSGMLLPGSTIQVSHLKDLVTLVDPTNPYSFTAFLAKHKRLYRFINARFPRVQRSEFNQYLQWVSRSLPNCHFREKVERVDYSATSKLFIMQTSRRVIKSKHLVLGNGQAPHIPEFAKSHIGDKVFHSKDFMFKQSYCAGKRVTIIGGGQSGAEIFQALLNNKAMLPTKLTWITRREQFSPIDDSVFANELFTPQHSETFYNSDSKQKAHVVKRHLLTSDGISPELLENIYQKLYTLEYLEGRGRFYELLPNHALLSIQSQQPYFALNLQNRATAIHRQLDTDVVILCTGYQYQLPTYLTSLMDYMLLDNGKFTVNTDFSITWHGPAENRIYVQNAARHSHGIADPNLSLMAWRSAKIINSIAEQQIYDIENDQDTIAWPDIYSASPADDEEVNTHAKYVN